MDEGICRDHRSAVMTRRADALPLACGFERRLWSGYVTAVRHGGLSVLSYCVVNLYGTTGEGLDLESQIAESRLYPMRHDNCRSAGNSGEKYHAGGCRAGGKLSSDGVGIRGDAAALDFVMHRWRSSQMLLQIFQIS